MKATFWISLLGLMLSGAGRATENPKEPVNLDRVKVDPVYWKAVQVTTQVGFVVDGQGRRERTENS